MPTHTMGNNFDGTKYEHVESTNLKDHMNKIDGQQALWNELPSVLKKFENKKIE